MRRPRRARCAGCRRNRCEAKADCVAVCPYGVFEIRRLLPEDKATLSFRGKLKAWAHGGKQAWSTRSLVMRVSCACEPAENAIRLLRFEAPSPLSHV